MSFPSPSLSRSSSKARPALCATLCRVYIDMPTRTVGRGVPLPRLPVKCSQEPVRGRLVDTCETDPPDDGRGACGIERPTVLTLFDIIYSAAART